ncbi:MAG: cytochrome ubiquinol oxidase subunit I [Desulfofustis sp. PB-SRB1]|nr:cytochrome ubiquinol oxidase subunit I [Desulfofustis sp. PB-SRB1]
METVIVLSRLQFAFTVMFHYIFPPLTIGLGIILAYLGNALLLHQKTDLCRRYPVLDENFRAQFRHRCGQRHRYGVSIWYQTGPPTHASWVMCSQCPGR